MGTRYLLLTTKEIREATALARQHNLNQKLTDAEVAMLPPEGVHVLGSFRAPHYHANGEPAILPHYRCQISLSFGAPKEMASGEDSQEMFLDIPTAILDRAVMVEAEFGEGDKVLGIHPVEGVRLQAPWDPKSALRRPENQITVDEEGLINLAGDRITMEDVALRSPAAAAAIEKVPPAERQEYLRNLIEEGAQLLAEAHMEDDAPRPDLAGPRRVPQIDQKQLGEAIESYGDEIKDIYG